MDYREIMPSAPLREYINCYWIISSDDEEMVPAEWDRTLPDGSLEIVIQLQDEMHRKHPHGEPEEEEKNILIGQVTEPYLFAPAGNTHMLGIRFFPHTAHYFFDFPASDITDTYLDLTLVWNKHWIERLKNKTRESENYSETVNQLEHILIEKLGNRDHTRSDRYFSHACKTIMNYGGKVPIADISNNIGISTRYLEQLFQQKLGISPKLFSSVIRFQQVFKFFNNPGPIMFTGIAYKAGYYDQAHFNREFKRFSGISPHQYIQEHHPFTRYFIDSEYCSYLYNSN